MKPVLPLLMTALAIGLGSCASAPSAREQSLPDPAAALLIGEGVPLELVSFKVDQAQYGGYSALTGNKLLIVTARISQEVGKVELAAMLGDVRAKFYDTVTMQMADSPLAMLDSGYFYPSREAIKKGVAYHAGAAMKLVFIYATAASKPISIMSPNEEKYLYGPDSAEMQAANAVSSRLELLGRLLEGSMIGDVEAVKSMLDADETIANAKINNLPSALFVASLSGRGDIVELLLAHGADPDFSWAMQDSSGIVATCFTAAVYKGHKDIVELYLKRGVDINAAEAPGWSAAMVAAYADNADMLDFLVKNGAALDQRLRYMWSGTSKGIVELAKERKSVKVLKYLEAIGISE